MKIDAEFSEQKIRDMEDLPAKSEALQHIKVETPNLSVANEYLHLFISLKNLDVRLRRTLTQNLQLVQANSPEEEKDIGRLLFLYYLEVDFQPEEALRWLLVAAKAGDVITQAIVYRMFHVLDKPIPADIPIQRWLWNGAIRCSTIALQDLHSENLEWYKQAKSAVKGKYGGLGIDIYQEFEVTLRLLAFFARDRSHDSDSDDDHPLGVVRVVQDKSPGWPGEVIRGIGHGRCDKFSPERGDFWEPTWTGQPHQTKSGAVFYASDPEKAFLTTMRIKKGHMYSVSGFGDTIVHYAANRGFLQLMQFVWDKYNPDLNDKNIFGETALLQACRAGHAKIVSFLLDKGADASITSARGETPLHWIGNVEQEKMPGLVSRLITGGASPAIRASYPDELQRAFGTEPQVYSDISLERCLFLFMLDFPRSGLPLRMVTPSCGLSREATLLSSRPFSATIMATNLMSSMLFGRLSS